MKKLKITFHKNVCIGNASCVSVNPKHFSLHEKHAKLRNSIDQKDDSFVLEGNFNDGDYNSLIEAAKACPVNAISAYDVESKSEIVGRGVKYSNTYREIMAKYDDSKDFRLDENGYFLIRVDRVNKNIEVAFCRGKNIIELKVVGKKPIDIYNTIISENIVSLKQHAAYLGRELQKAYIALEKGIEYVQDDELDFLKKV